MKALLLIQNCMGIWGIRIYSWVLAFALTTSLSLTANGKPAGDSWNVIKQKSGIVVSEQKVEGRSFPIFRGVAIINASIFDILAVVQDTPRNAEWMHNCMESRQLERLNEWDMVLYNRTDAPWPVDDRDAIIKSKFEVFPETREIHVHVESTTHQAQGLIDGVVRMPNLYGHYIFKVLGENVTKVDMKINADPGGWIPKWVASLVSRDIPYKTLVNLRKQVKKTRGAPEYRAFIKKAKVLGTKLGLTGGTQVAQGPVFAK